MGNIVRPEDDPRMGNFCGKFYPLEIINGEDKAVARNQASVSYNLERNMTLTVKAQKNTIRAIEGQNQNIPMLINVHTTDFTREQLLGRPSIDLICIIDRSGSMQGEKLDLVKKALLNLLQLTNEYDRFCLIQFDSRARQLTPLLRNSAQNRAHLTSVINSITAQGDNNLNDAMKIAFEVMNNRSTANAITSIFILTDGVEISSNPFKDITKSLTIANMNNKNFAISCFGFGADHDEKLLIKIANLKDGNFYYIQKLNTISQAFASALAGLISIVALDTTITVKHIAPDPFRQIKIINDFGTKWKMNTAGDLEIKLNQLLAGKDKGFISQITFPSINSRVMSNYKNAKIPICEVIIRSLDKSRKFMIEDKQILTLTIVNDKEPHILIQDDVEVTENVFRVKGAEAIERAISQLNSEYGYGNYYELQQLVNQISANRVVDQRRMAHLVGELRKCIEKIQKIQRSPIQMIPSINCARLPEDFKTMYEVHHALSNQQALPRTSMYQNVVEAQFVERTMNKAN